MDSLIEINMSNFRNNICNHFNLSNKNLIKLYKSNKKYISKDKPNIKFTTTKFDIYKDNSGVKYILIEPIKDNIYFAFKIIAE